MPRTDAMKEQVGASVTEEIERMKTEAEQAVVEGGAEESVPVLKVKMLRAAKAPATWFDGDAGFDLEFVPADGLATVVHPGTTSFCQTGVAVAIPEGYAGLVLPRSGMAAKRGLRPTNTPGLIDSSYRGEIVVALEATQSRQMVMPGERIAQLLLVPVLTPEIEAVDELDETERGDAGFGSTD